MKLNRFLKSLLKASLHMIDQTIEQVDRVSDRGSHMVGDARNNIWPKEDHVVHNVLSFAAGVGLGVGACLLLTPSSGADVRNSIKDRIRGITDMVTGRIPTEDPATRTENPLAS